MKRAGARGGRGGIQKSGRGGPAVRLDKDGDVAMGAAPSVRGGRGSRGARGSRGGIQKDATGARLDAPIKNNRLNKSIINTEAIKKHLKMSHAEDTAMKTMSIIKDVAGENTRKGTLDEVAVRGIKNSKAASNPDGGLKALIDFLQRKASGANTKLNQLLRIKKSRMEGDIVIISVKPEDTQRFLRLDGFSFSGAQIKLELDKPAEGLSKEGVAIKDKLKAMLERRYDGSQKILDLSSLGTDPEFVNTGMFDSQSRDSKFFEALMTVCDDAFTSKQQKQELVPSVSLARNALSSVSIVTLLAQTFPDIKNLDLTSNQFKDLSAIEPWRRKFRSLERLYLADNPFTTIDNNWQEEVKRWFPSLLVLDGVQIRTEEEAQAETARRKLAHFEVSSPLFHDTNGVCSTFLRNFFEGYDGDRNMLINAYYDQHSKFSMNVNTGAPNQGKPDPWEDNIKKSRNLGKVTTPTGRSIRLARGAQQIRNMWLELPVTRHPSIETEPEKWLIECHVVPGLSDRSGQSAGGVNGFIIVLHGEYDEMDVSKNIATAHRSFDRTLIIGPGDGYDGIRVVCDMLTLRGYAGFEAFQRAKANASNDAVLPDLPPLPLGYGLPTLEKSPEQVQYEQLEISLMRASRLTLEYAKMCLETVQYDPARAVQSFETVKNSLPPEAFF